MAKTLKCIASTEDQYLIEKCLHYGMVRCLRADELTKETFYWDKELDIQTTQNVNYLKDLHSIIEQ
jgi:hypothetical protein